MLWYCVLRCLCRLIVFFLVSVFACYDYITCIDSTKSVVEKYGDIVRNFRLLDDDNRVYTIEVQRDSAGAGAKRARRNGALLDASVSTSLTVEEVEELKKSA